MRCSSRPSNSSQQDTAVHTEPLPPLPAAREPGHSLEHLDQTEVPAWEFLSLLGSSCPEVCAKDPSPPQRAGIQPLGLGGCQSRSWRMPSPQETIFKEKSEMNKKVTFVTLCIKPQVDSHFCIGWETHEIKIVGLFKKYIVSHEFTKLWLHRRTWPTSLNNLMTICFTFLCFWRSSGRSTGLKGDSQSKKDTSKLRVAGFSPTKLVLWEEVV